MGCSRIRLRRRCRRCSRSASATAAPGRDVLTAYQIGGRSRNARSPKRSIRAITRTAFTARRPCGTIAAAAAPRSCSASIVEQTRARARHRRQPGGGPARELRHHDQALPCRTRLRKRRRRGRIRAARLHRDTDRSSKPTAASSRRPAAATTPHAIDGKLGNPWTFAFPGVSIKPHPSGSLTHPGMGLMLRPHPRSTTSSRARCKRVRRRHQPPTCPMR